MHEAFFFGPNERQLFAIYHPPAGVDRQLLTVICPPLFAELNRTHAILRKLAVSLAEHGQHVLRMDYSGTGDSFGHLEDMTITDWVQDIALTVQEGRELSGCNEIQILGVRASALLACKSAAKISDLCRLVLWDPVIDGAEYLRSLDSKKVAILNENLLISRAKRREAMQKPTIHNLSEQLLEDFCALGASIYSEAPKDKLCVVSTSSENDIPVPGVSRVELKFDCHWEMASEGMIVSRPLLEDLIQCLTKS
jgi:hypothetical protein